MSGFVKMNDGAKLRGIPTFVKSLTQKCDTYFLESIL
jgi:hypothetical protein